MSDRELIERAAKAANIKGKWGRESFIERNPGFMRPGWRRAWEPLRKNEDAMPLMVRLSMTVAVDVEYKTVAAVFYGGIAAEEAFTNCESAEVAARRAIVRCAAAALPLIAQGRTQAPSAESPEASARNTRSARTDRPEPDSGSAGGKEREGTA